MRIFLMSVVSTNCVVTFYGEGGENLLVTFSADYGSGYVTITPLGTKNDNMFILNDGTPKISTGYFIYSCI